MSDKIINKFIIKNIYNKYKDLNKNQREILLHQFSYNASLAYIPDTGYSR